MNPVVLDTHVLVWLLEGHRSLGKAARTTADAALQEDGLLVSAITFWEVAMLARRGRLELNRAVDAWRNEVLGLGVREIPVTGHIGILATELEAFPADPADRIVAATAMAQGATLVTADTRILTAIGGPAVHDASS
ncbi:MAG: type II toxin-antitoxin system VapC family toxin [Chloroflexi bacterium]|nr:type II toxin-antitoxin system VapC family toxin [Chloroflexota bacterium]